MGPEWSDSGLLVEDGFESHEVGGARVWKDELRLWPATFVGKLNLTSRPSHLGCRDAHKYTMLSFTQDPTYDEDPNRMAYAKYWFRTILSGHSLILVTFFSSGSLSVSYYSPVPIQQGSDIQSGQRCDETMPLSAVSRFGLPSSTSCFLWETASSWLQWIKLGIMSRDQNQ